MTDAEMLACATTFTLRPISRRALLGTIRELKVEFRNHDPEAWAILGDGWCLNHDGEWEWESQPSSRTEDFFIRCRWPSARAAIEAAEAHMQRYPTGHKPEEPA